MTDRELMQQVLEDICGAKLCEINSMSSRVEMIRLMDSAITALRERLAQPEQEPVAWVTGWHDGHCVIRAVDPAVILPIGTAFYTTPQPETVIDKSAAIRARGRG